MVWNATENQNDGRNHMGLFVIIAISCLAAWPVVATMLRLRRHRFSAKWWIAAGLLVVFGTIVGQWVALQFEYQLCSRAKISGAPLPLVIFIFEDGQWTDFVPPPIIQYGAIIADTLVAIALVTMPLNVWSWLLVRRKAQ